MYNEFGSDTMVAQVLVGLKTTHIDQTFSYIIPDSILDKISVGSRVLVPFGRQKLEGFVISLDSEFHSDYKLKEILELIDEEPVLSNELLSLGKWLRKKTLCTLVTAYQTMLPTFMKAGNSLKTTNKMVTYLRLITKDGVTSSKQQEVLSLFHGFDVLKSEAMKVSSSAVKTLIAHCNIEEYSVQANRRSNSFMELEEKKNLTKEQENAYTLISNSFFKFSPFLLHGVTGSGKTEVYLQLIDSILKQGKEALVLVPEISLTPQFISIFERRFGALVAVLHSGLSAGEKYDEWRRIVRGEAKIVIGARSAVFAPLTNIGIIIVDEEHSTTYKQENHPRYHAIDVALTRGKYYQCPVILGSATPSLESYTRAKAGVYGLVEMKERVNHNLPNVHLIDMKQELRHGAPVLSRMLKDKIEERIARGEQVMLLLNRRGFSTSVICKNCGFTHKCPNCDIPLIYHKKDENMTCHYCGYRVSKLRECPICHNKELSSMGMGTEKLEQYVTSKIEGAKVIRMDNDTTSRKGAHEAIISAFGRGEYNILIGTQMIAKGLDFPNVTLVGVVSADSSLGIPDFRSSERTFELLCQVAGRAGRGEKVGEVIIQGFNIDHYSIVDASHHDYISFYNHEMAIRKRLKYSPYYNVSVIGLKGKDYDYVNTEAMKIASHLRKELMDVIVLGPSAALIPKINNIYNIQIILKYKKSEKVMEQFYFVQDMYRKNARIQVDIDCSPIHL